MRAKESERAVQGRGYSTRCHNRPQEQKLFQTIPGAGPLTSAACVSEIKDITRFPKAKQLIAFIGIDPNVHQSGSSIDKYRRISKQGKPYRVALVATMNKMARVIHAVWTHNTSYQEPTR